MRFVPSVSPPTTSPDTRTVRGLSATHAVKPVHPLEQPVPYVENNTAQQEALHAVDRQYRNVPLVDRRKACRRLIHQPVLIELRSGIDRRRHNLLKGDVVEHIDETA